MPNPGVANGNGLEAMVTDIVALALGAEENDQPNLPMLDIPMVVPLTLDAPFGDFPEVTITDTERGPLNPNPTMVPELPTIPMVDHPTLAELFGVPGEAKGRLNPPMLTIPMVDHPMLAAPFGASPEAMDIMVEICSF